MWFKCESGGAGDWLLSNVLVDWILLVYNYEYLNRTKMESL